MVVADAYPNFSICSIPYYISGEVTHWRNLAHRTYANIEVNGIAVRLDKTMVTGIEPGWPPAAAAAEANGTDENLLAYDRLVVGTGALPVRPPIAGSEWSRRSSPGAGVHLLHSMGDTFALQGGLEEDARRQAP